MKTTNLLPLATASFKIPSTEEVVLPVSLDLTSIQ